MLMSNKIKREVVERYNRGERATDLAKEYGISRGIIYRWIKEEFPMKGEDDDRTYGELEMENRLLRNQLREVYQTLEDMRKHLELISSRIRPF